MSLDIARLISNRIIGAHIKDYVVSCSLLGANTVVTNTSSTKQLVLLQYILDCATPGNTVTWQDSDGVVHSGAMPFSETGGLVAPFSDGGWFMLSPGKSLVAYLAVAAPVTGHLSCAAIQF